jgi:hypothetical protein
MKSCIDCTQVLLRTSYSHVSLEGFAAGVAGGSFLIHDSAAVNDQIPKL